MLHVYFFNFTSHFLTVKFLRREPLLQRAWRLGF